MESAAAIKSNGLLKNKRTKVEGIMPANSIEVTEQGIEIKPSFLQRLAEGIEKRKEERKIKKATKETERDMDQMRDELICEAFGITPEKLKEYRKLHKKMQKIEERANRSGTRQDVSALNDSLAVYNAKDKTAGIALMTSGVGMVIDTGIGAASMAITGHATSLTAMITTALTGTQAFVPLGQIIASAFLLTLGGFGLYKLLKSRKGKDADRDEQGRAFDEKYKETILEPLQKIEPQLQALKSKAIEAKLNMSKEQFNLWLKSELTAIFKEFNVGNFEASVEQVSKKEIQEIVGEQNSETKSAKTDEEFLEATGQKEGARAKTDEEFLEAMRKKQETAQQEQGLNNDKDNALKKKKQQESLEETGLGE